ncbi:MAG: NAD-binding protein [Clostridia bacterium]|nr:NAD-binding protein [Clostridia bacterium]
MKIIIIGGGKVGYYLVKTLLPNRHKITIIEKSVERCNKIASELDVEVISGDGTDIGLLSETGIEKADVFIAVTGKDQDNLIACQLAKRNFHVKRTIARVNNPKNISVFEKLGVDLAVSSTSIIAEMIEKEIDYTSVKTLIKLKKGNLVLTEIEVSKKSAACNKKLKDMNLPGEVVLMSVIRGETTYIPNGHTVLRENDTVFVICKQENQQEVIDYFS